MEKGVYMVMVVILIVKAGVAVQPVRAVKFRLPALADLLALFRILSSVCILKTDVLMF
jgi:hypothetical protein